MPGSTTSLQNELRRTLRLERKRRVEDLEAEKGWSYSRSCASQPNSCPATPVPWPVPLSCLADMGLVAVCTFSTVTGCGPWRNGVAKPFQVPSRVARCERSTTRRQRSQTFVLVSCAQDELLIVWLASGLNVPFRRQASAIPIQHAIPTDPVELVQRAFNASSCYIHECHRLCPPSRLTPCDPSRPSTGSQIPRITPPGLAGGSPSAKGNYRRTPGPCGTSQWRRCRE